MGWKFLDSHVAISVKPENLTILNQKKVHASRVRLCNLQASVGLVERSDTSDRRVGAMISRRSKKLSTLAVRFGGAHGRYR
jgi:hypothetical protein